jgi:hypothetical protein
MFKFDWFRFLLTSAALLPLREGSGRDPVYVLGV